MATANSTQAEPTIASDGHKRCNKCGETKLLSEFYSNKKKSGGYKPACKCKACDNARRLALYRSPRSREKRIALYHSPESLAKRKQSANYDEWRNKFGSDYGVRPCKKCGVNIWGIKPRRDFCEACFAIARDESKAARDDWKASWGRACKTWFRTIRRKAIRQANPDIAWIKKCDSIASGIQKRRIRKSTQSLRTTEDWDALAIQEGLRTFAEVVRSSRCEWSIKCNTTYTNWRRIFNGN